jgi:hypothetical protein
MALVDGSNSAHGGVVRVAVAVVTPFTCRFGQPERPGLPQWIVIG